MGDFNDNPFNKSITQYLMAINNKVFVKSNRVRLKYFYNVMHRFLDAQIGTFVFGNEYNMLDQFMISKSILSEKQNCLLIKYGSHYLLLRTYFWDVPETCKVW